MKIQNVGLDNAYAIVRGWVSDLAAAATGLISVTDETTGTTVGPVSSMTFPGQLLNDGGSGNLVIDIQAVLTEYTNNSGVDLIYGDVVVIDTSADEAVTTTTTAQDTRPVGIVLEPIGAGGTGPVQTAGIVQFVNVVSSVTRGEYAETSTTAKKATQNAARRAGSFGIYLKAGTSPALLLFGITDGSNSAATTVGGNDVVWPQGVAMPSWVKPTGSGVITADPQGRLGVMTGTSYKSFPGMAFLEGRLHLVYRTGSAHNSAGATIDYKWSDDLGQTWFPAGTSVSLVTATGSNDVRDPFIIALSSGRLLIGYDARNPYNSLNISIKVIYSDNRGQSWSSPYTIPAVTTGDEVAGTSQPIEMPDGSILIFGNINDTAGGVLFSVLWKSTDGGLTFPTQITVAKNIAVREYAEPQARLLASGNLVCLLRSDTSGHTYRTVSTDQGATWSSPADVLTASSRPDFVEFFPNALILFCRVDPTNNYARWTISWDEGLTWTALQDLDPSFPTELLMYAAPVVLAPGYVTVVYSIENSGSDADLYLRYFYDGYGTDVIGNLRSLFGATLPSTSVPVAGQIWSALTTSTSGWIDQPVVETDRHAEILLVPGFDNPPEFILSPDGTYFVYGWFDG